MIRNTSPPDRKLAIVNWTVLCSLAERLPVRLCTLARTGVALKVGRLSVKESGPAMGT